MNKNEIRPAMSEAALEARREYYRTWRRNNKEKCAEYQRNRWERKAAQIAKMQEKRDGE